MQSRLIVAFALLAVSHAFYTGSDVRELNAFNFNAKVLEKNDVWLVEFYAPWCGHCKSLAPAWMEVAGKLKGRVKVGAVNCDDKTNAQLTQQYGVRGFPTIKLFIDGVPQDYNGARDAASIRSFALRAYPDLVRKVRAKNEESFMKKSADDHVVMFFSAKEKYPWTAMHEYLPLEQKRAGVAWSASDPTGAMHDSDVAYRLRHRARVGFVNDKEKSILEKHGIQNVPGVLVIRRGATAADDKTIVFQGDASDLTEIKQFLKEHVAKPSPRSKSSKAENGSTKSKKTKSKKQRKQRGSSQRSGQDPFYAGTSVEVVNDASAYASLRKSGEPMLVEVYAPWCGHCQNMKQPYTAVAKRLEGRMRVVAVNGDDSSGRSIAQEEGVRGFPTIFAYDGNGKRHDFQSGPDEGALFDFASAFARPARPKPAKDEAAPRAFQSGDVDDACRHWKGICVVLLHDGEENKSLALAKEYDSLYRKDRMRFLSASLPALAHVPEGARAGDALAINARRSKVTVVKNARDTKVFASFVTRLVNGDIRFSRFDKAVDVNGTGKEEL